MDIKIKDYEFHIPYDHIYSWEIDFVNHLIDVKAIEYIEAKMDERLVVIIISMFITNFIRPHQIWTNNFLWLCETSERKEQIIQIGLKVIHYFRQIFQYELANIYINNINIESSYPFN